MAREEVLELKNALLEQQRGWQDRMEGMLLNAQQSTTPSQSEFFAQFQEATKTLHNKINDHIADEAAWRTANDEKLTALIGIAEELKSYIEAKKVATGIWHFVSWVAKQVGRLPKWVLIPLAAFISGLLGYKITL